MAHKRMFSKDITGSDAFRDMPSSSQNLYFHLGMEADDDGFLGNYKALMRGISATEDDLKILLTKRFLIMFNSGVIVIKHWLIHNTIRKDRYNETKYLDDKKTLFIKDNKAYTDNSNNGLPSGNQVATQYRIGKDRIVKKRSDKSQSKTFNILGAEVLKAFEVVDPKNKTYYGNKTQRACADFLVNEYGLETVLKVIAILPKVNQQKLYVSQITTPYELKENWVKVKNALLKVKNDKNYVL